MTPENNPLKLHTLFKGLEHKKLFVAEVDRDTRYHIVEEARGMQKMKVTESTISPVVDGKRVPLHDTIKGHHDFLVFPVHPYIIKDIQQSIATNIQNVILLLEGDQIADSTCDAAIKLWRKQNIPMINKDEHKQDLPFTLMKTMNAMITK